MIFIVLNTKDTSPVVHIMSVLICKNVLFNVVAGLLIFSLKNSMCL